MIATSKNWYSKYPYNAMRAGVNDDRPVVIVDPERDEAVVYSRKW